MVMARQGVRDTATRNLDIRRIDEAKAKRRQECEELQKDDVVWHRESAAHAKQHARVLEVTGNW